MTDWQLSENERVVLRRALEIVSGTPPADGPARSGGRSRINGDGLAAGSDNCSEGYRDSRSAIGPSSTGDSLAMSSGRRQPSSNLVAHERFNPLGSLRRRSATTPSRALLNLRSRCGTGLDQSYDSVESSLRGVRREVKEEQSSLFNWSKRKVCSSWTHKFVCLSSTNADRVPTHQFEKITLEEAGLGERTVTIPDITCSPEDFVHILLATFPKLDLGGGFELLRCKPQSRELMLIGPRISSHPNLLKRHVGNGKVYVRPIQRDLSLEEVSVEEIEGVEERCLDCGRKINVAKLRRHMEECPGGPSVVRSRSQSPTREEYAIMTSDSDSELPVVNVRSSQQSWSPAACDDAEDIMMATAISNSMSDAVMKPTCVKDILTSLQDKHKVKIAVCEEDWGTLPRTNILIRRGKLLTDALREVRKKRYDPTKLLNVCFVEEEAIDTGGPSREFWRMFIDDVVNQYCVGEPGISLFMKNIPALQNEDFKMIGKLVATSIVQGGPGFPVLLPAAYSYICSEAYIDKLTDVPDPQVKRLLENVEKAECDASLREVFLDGDFETIMLETGYRKPLPLLVMADKDNVTETLKAHVLLRVKAELDQFSEGLSTCGVLEAIRQNSALMSTYFIYSSVTLTADYFRTLFNVVFSEQPTKKEKEHATYINFMDYIEDCEGGTVITDDGQQVELSHIMVFFSGALKEPPLGFRERPTLCFIEGNLATASTCMLKLRLPYCHEDYKSFSKYMTLSLKGHEGFGVV